MNRVADDIQESRDRLDVLGIQRRFLGIENEGQIELPPDDSEEVDVLGSNWADQQIMTSDSNLTDEELGMIPPASSSLRRDPQWKRVLKEKVLPLRPPITQNPKYELPQNTTTVDTTEPPIQPLEPPRVVVDDDLPNNSNEPPPSQIKEVLRIETIPIPILQRQESVNVFLYLCLE